MVEKNFRKVPDDSLSLKFLYHTLPGRALLSILKLPPLSTLAGLFMDSRASRFLIPVFIRANKIDMIDYMDEEYTCFNDFFSRRIRPEQRPIDPDSSKLISPCDGLLSAYRIQGDTVIPVKHSRYTLRRLLRDSRLAASFEGGYCLVFRLCVDNYHHYCYPASGTKTSNRFIPGVLHTVRPIALAASPVFTENAREYTLIHSRHLGDIIQMEVGAMLVGRICNHHGKGTIVRGQEKGFFEYGGSTIILLLQKDAAKLPEWLFETSSNECEIPVKYGEALSE